MSNVVPLKEFMDNLTEQMQERHTAEVLQCLEAVERRIEMGETLGLFVVEIPNEITELRTGFVGVDGWDIMEFIGLLEMVKARALEVASA